MKLEKTKARLIGERFDALEQDLYMKAAYAEEKLQAIASDASKRVKEAAGRVGDYQKEMEVNSFTRFDLCVERLKKKLDKSCAETTAATQALRSEIGETAQGVSALFVAEGRTREKEEELLIHEIERSISNLRQIYSFS